MKVLKNVGYTIGGGILGFSFTVGVGEIIKYLPGIPDEQETNNSLAYYKEQLPILEEDYKKAVIQIGDTCFKLINPIVEGSDSQVNIATNLLSDKNNSCGDNPDIINNNLTSFFNAKNALDENITNTQLSNNDLDRIKSNEQFVLAQGFTFAFIGAIGGFIRSKIKESDNEDDNDQTNNNA